MNLGVESTSSRVEGIDELKIIQRPTRNHYVPTQSHLTGLLVAPDEEQSSLSASNPAGLTAGLLWLRPRHQMATLSLIGDGTGTGAGALGTDQQAEHREGGMGTPNRKKSPENRKENPENRKEIPANSKESPENRKEIPANSKESPENRKESPERGGMRAQTGRPHWSQSFTGAGPQSHPTGGVPHPTAPDALIEMEVQHL
ncbi:unnamed protein product [Boreogadus saida]